LPVLSEFVEQLFKEKKAIATISAKGIRKEKGFFIIVGSLINVAKTSH
jgi:hypothetical protein